MTTAQFLAHLDAHADRRLTFGAGAVRVSPGYHVTEVKATTIHAADCGGRATSWNETTLQLWSPSAESSGDHMPVRKFLDIYGRVATMVPIDADARVRVEYGAPGDAAVSYVVMDVVPAEGGELEVRLAAPAVACKGRDRSVGDVPLVDAAGPPPVRPVESVEVAAGGCCTPAGPAGAAACCA